MLSLVIFATILALSQQESVWDNLSANIAVVEYKPQPRVNLAAVDFLTNIVAYTGIMEELKNESLDLIVFPESTLGNDRSTAVDVKLNQVLNQTSNINSPLDILAFLASTYNTYLVVNLVEQEKCEKDDVSKNCKNFGSHFYNTDVVFDRNGTVITKYRKFNLFGEFEKDKPETADQVVIKTDFGVNFGIFTCFDILFKSPAQDLLSQNIDGVIFPTMWFSELPFLTALQAQQMWAHAHDIAFFSAGANNPAVGSGGTGVFRGSQGAVLGDTLAKGGSKSFLYKSVNGEFQRQDPEDVDTLAKNMDDFYLKIDPSLKDYIAVELDTSKPSLDTQFCTQDEDELPLCCNFTLKMSQRAPKPNFNYYTYLMVVFSGVRTFDGVYNGGIEICGLLACRNTSLSSCGSRFPKYEEVDWPVTFDEVTIVGSFEKSENKTQFPNSLLSSIKPIDASKTVWIGEEVEENGTSFIQRTWSVKEQDRLMTFAIYGRNFGTDFAPPDNGDDDDDDDGGDGDDGNSDEDKPSGSSSTWGFSYWLLLLVLGHCRNM